MRVHPAAKAFPLLEGEEFADFVADIKAHGQQVPIVLQGDTLLDGRNRVRACKELGIEPKAVQWAENGSSAAAYIVSVNLKRRHLDASQKAAIAVELLPEFKKEIRPGRPKKGAEKKAPKNGGDSHAGEASAAAAAAVGVSRGYVEQEDGTWGRP